MPNVSQVLKCNTQMTLDFGQKEFGTKVCKECGMIYTASDKSDSDAHAKYHKQIISNNLRVNRWQGQEVRQEFLDGSRIVEILQTDLRVGMPVFKQIAFRMNQDLGFDRPIISSLTSKKVPDDAGVLLADWRIFVYVLGTGNRMAGCCITEDLSSSTVRQRGYLPRRLTGGRASLLAWRLQTDLLDITPHSDLLDITPHSDQPDLRADSSSGVSVVGACELQTNKSSDKHSAARRVNLAEPQDVLPLCGVRRFWVLRKHRRTGIASALVDCARQNFALGVSLPRNRVAFAEPTADGANFAVAFTGLEDFYTY